VKLIFVLAFLFAPSAFACGPWGCYSTTCLTYGPDSTNLPDLDTCGQEQVSHLDPNNVTESNFGILASELSGGAHARSEHDSSSASSDESRETLPPEEARTTFDKGVAAFRASAYDKAIEFFKQITDSDRNAARAAYYIARSYLRWSQKDYDGYSRDKIKSEYALKALNAFRDFAKKYPEHEWTPSAIGLVRRAEFLTNDTAGYSADWGAKVDEALAASPRDVDTLSNLFSEAALFNLKEISEATHLHPVLWMIRAYYVTRQFKDGDAFAFDLDAQLKALETDQKSFAKYRDLYAWSRAVLLLKLNRAQEGYELLQKQSVAKTNGGSLSWLILNARLLMAQGKYDQARSLLAPFIQSHPFQKSKSERPEAGRGKEIIATYEIGPNSAADQHPGFDVATDSRNFYSMTYVWEKKPAALITQKNLDLLSDAPIARVFAQGLSPEEIGEILSNDKLGKNVRAVVEPLAMAKLIALNKWSEAVGVYQHISTPKVRKDFAELAKSAKALSTNDKDAEANARVGMFLANIEPSPLIFAPCEKQTFDTKMTSAMDFYLKGLEGFKADEKTKNPVEASMLREMLICFKDHYGAPYCGEKAVKWDESKSLPISARKSWWQRLKQRFPKSKEAKSTTVYW
jgi:outer membrane protein assembly factor BamD (BamD/ComL family)